MLKTIAENDNHHDLRNRSQGKDENISKTFAFVFHHGI